LKLELTGKLKSGDRLAKRPTTLPLEVSFFAFERRCHFHFQCRSSACDCYFRAAHLEQPEMRPRETGHTHCAAAPQLAGPNQPIRQERAPKAATALLHLANSKPRSALEGSMGCSVGRQHGSGWREAACVGQQSPCCPFHSLLVQRL